MINVNKTLTYTHVFRVCAKRMPYEPSQDEKFVYKQNVFWSATLVDIKRIDHI